MKKSLILAGLLMSAALALTGCVSTTDEGDATNTKTVEEKTYQGRNVNDKGHNTKLSAYKVKFADEATVTCIQYNDHEKGGVDCDWANLNMESDKKTSRDLAGSVETVNGVKVYCVTMDAITKGAVDCNF